MTGKSGFQERDCHSATAAKRGASAATASEDDCLSFSQTSEKLGGHVCCCGQGSWKREGLLLPMRRESPAVEEASGEREADQHQNFNLGQDCFRPRLNVSQRNY